MNTSASTKRRGIVRRGDRTSGHDDYPPRVAVTWSPDVFCNRRNVERKDDQLGTHCNHKGENCHNGHYKGERNIWANRRPVQVVDDPIDCEGMFTEYCAEGSSDTW